MRRRTSSTLPGAGAQSHTRAARACDEELRDPPRVGVPVRRRGLRGELFRGGAVRGRVSGVGTVPKQRRRDLVAPGAHGVVQRREAVVVLQRLVGTDLEEERRRRVTLKSEVRTRMVHARAPLAHVELFFELNSTEL